MRKQLEQNFIRDVLSKDRGREAGYWSWWDMIEYIYCKLHKLWPIFTLFYRRLYTKMLPSSCPLYSLTDFPSIALW